MNILGGFLMYSAILLPPAQYDHPNPHAQIRWMSQDQVHFTCHGGAACAFPMKWRPDSKSAWQRHCIIVAYHDSRYGDPAVIRHEMGHCNGWGADHAGGHY